MRLIGLDLSSGSEYKAVVMDAQGEVVGPVLKLKVWPADWSGLLRQARQGVAADEPIGVVVELTGGTGMPVVKYLAQQPGVAVYLLTPLQPAARRLTLRLMEVGESFPNCPDSELKLHSFYYA